MQLAASLPRHREKKTNGAAGDTSLPLYLALLSVLSTQAALQPSRSLREVRCCRNQQEVAGTGFSLTAIPVAGNGGWHPAGPSRHHTEPAAQGQPSKAHGTCTDIILSGAEGDVHLSHTGASNISKNCCAFGCNWAHRVLTPSVVTFHLFLDRKTK